MLNKQEDLFINWMDASIVEEHFYLYRRSNRLMRSSSRRMRKLINEFMTKGFIG